MSYAVPSELVEDALGLFSFWVEERDCPPATALQALAAAQLLILAEVPR